MAVCHCPECRKSRPSENYSTFNNVVTVRGLVARKNVHILIDTGSVVTEEILRDCSTVTRTTAANKLVIAANGEPLELVGTAEIPIIIQKEVVRLVSKNIMQECILGADFLQALKCVIDLNNNTLHVNGKVIPLQVSARLLYGRMVCSSLVTLHQPVNVIANERVDGEWTPQRRNSGRDTKLLWLIHFELHFLSHSNVKSFGIYPQENLGDLRPIVIVCCLKSVNILQLYHLLFGK